MLGVRFKKIPKTPARPIDGQRYWMACSSVNNPDRRYGQAQPQRRRHLTWTLKNCELNDGVIVYGEAAAGTLVYGPVTLSAD